MTAQPVTALTVAVAQALTEAGVYTFPDPAVGPGVLCIELLTATTLAWVDLADGTHATTMDRAETLRVITGGPFDREPPCGDERCVSSAVLEFVLEHRAAVWSR